MDRKDEVINVLEIHKKDLIEKITPLFKENPEQGRIKFISSRNTLERIINRDFLNESFNKSFFPFDGEKSFEYLIEHISSLIIRIQKDEIEINEKQEDV